MGLALAVKIAEAIALGRKQTFIPRSRSAVYRRRHPVGDSLPYSGRGFTLYIKDFGALSVENAGHALRMQGSQARILSGAPIFSKG